MELIQFPSPQTDSNYLTLVLNYFNFCRIINLPAINNPIINPTECIQEFFEFCTRLRIWEDLDNPSKLLNHQIWRFIDRLSRLNPISNFRNSMSDIRYTLSSLGFKSLNPCSSSRFFRFDNLPPHTMIDDPFWIRIFLDLHGRIIALHRALASDSSMFIKHYQTHHFTMYEESGPLPPPWRHFLAILSASRHHCDYLSRLESCLFLASGGEYNWLLDPINIPEKLKRIQGLISLLAHQPWQIKSKDFHDLMTGVQPWTVAEICQALLIITHYHALSSMTWGLGLSCEDLEDLGNDCVYSDDSDEDDGHLNNLSTTYDPCCTDTGVLGFDIKPDSEITRSIDFSSSLKSDELANTENSSKLTLNNRLNQDIREIECDAQIKEMIIYLAKFAPNKDTPYPKFDEQIFKKRNFDESAIKEIMKKGPKLRPSYSDRFRTDNNTYENLQFKYLNKNLIHVNCSNLNDNSILTLDLYYPNASTILCNELENLNSKEYFSLRGEHVATTKPLRDAVWHYSHRLFGIQCHQFDEHLTNKFMTLGQKIFIKKLLCYPERLMQRDFKHMIFLFEIKDLIHYIYYACQARKMASLSISLHALADSMC